MTALKRLCGFVIAFGFCGLPAYSVAQEVPSPGPAKERALLDFGKDFDPATIESHNAKLAMKDGSLVMTAENAGQAAGFAFKPSDGRWNLLECHEIAIRVKNTGKQPLTVCGEAKSPTTCSAGSATGSVALSPGERSIIRIVLTQALPPELRLQFIGMRGVPLGIPADIDSSNITEVALSIADPPENCSIEIGNPRLWVLWEPTQPISEKQMFPMIDRFGQFMHKNWPGKTHSEQELADRKKSECDDLAAHPGPDDWDQYGGWKTGPQLRATGFFRTEKQGGKWWLVDPEGHLFWSQGMNCVGWGEGRTPIGDRKHWYLDLPKTDSPLAQFYGSETGGVHNYYEGKETPNFDFFGANVYRKYGPDWKKEFAELAVQRLRSWGLNTLGLWTASEVQDKHKMPYIGGAGLGDCKPIAGSKGYWGRFADVFDPNFAAAVTRTIVNKKCAEDPWCIGYYVDNELCWGDEVSLAVATLISPADQPAKREFVNDLRKKYEVIGNLNSAWGTEHGSWEALLESTAAPDLKKARADLLAFNTRISNRYFEVASAALKRSAPNQLYLGCRFSRSNEPAVRAAAKYCDVVSFNRYQYSLEDLRLPTGEDKPVIIGEFHFGALDRGMFHTGLSPTSDQMDRARAYKEYVEGAARNPCIVGVNYFQFTDQATTGRGDGENYQIGFVDICDTPYPEIIAAARAVGNNLYRRRHGP